MFTGQYEDHNKKYETYTHELDAKTMFEECQDEDNDKPLVERVKANLLVLYATKRGIQALAKEVADVATMFAPNLSFEDLFADIAARVAIPKSKLGSAKQISDAYLQLTTSDCSAKVPKEPTIQIKCTSSTCIFDHSKFASSNFKAIDEAYYFRAGQKFGGRACKNEECRKNPLTDGVNQKKQWHVCTALDLEKEESINCQAIYCNLCYVTMCEKHGGRERRARK